MKKKVGYLGPEGTFSEEASTIYRKYVKNVEFLPFATIHELLRSVDRGKVSEGIVPIENSIEGTVGVVPDMLAKEVNLKIYQEINLPIVHNLLSLPKTKLNEITDIISHPQALDQCQAFIKRKLSGAKLHLSYSTADAAHKVAQSGTRTLNDVLEGPERKFAAIASFSAARLYKLKPLAKAINAVGNATRFVVLAKEDHRPTGRDKTSIVFSILKDHPGGLYDILGEFAGRNINLTKIESRPAKKSLGDYLFFVDLQGHHQESDISAALRNVKRRASFFKLLGSYPEAKMPRKGK